MRNLPMWSSVPYVRHFLEICVLPQISLRNYKNDVSLFSSIDTKTFHRESP